MINPQSTTLIQAYDPYLTEERYMYLMPGTQWPLKEFPSDDDPNWKYAFSFDAENVLCHVFVERFTSLDAARTHLVKTMEDSKKMYRIGGFTDVITIAEYDLWMSSYSDNSYEGY